ncbi:MAG: TetR/AcrR family transcriptional regulator [Hydrogeniiclostridium sp.]
MREFIAFSLKAFYNVEKKKESEAGDMPGLREVQKAEKKANLLQAAYTCFLEKGIHKTSIDDIVARANVAKGTFYLYFKDKASLFDQLCIEVSKRVLRHAYQKVKEQKLTEYTDIVIGFLDAVIEYFKTHKATLMLLEKNFSWPLIEQNLQTSENEDLQDIRETLLKNPYHPEEEEQAFQYLFSIVALCGSVGYSSIIRGEPDTIDHMKPILYTMIRRILR